jgi:hypothetical protein
MSDLAIRVENLSKRYHIGRAKQRHDMTYELYDLENAFKERENLCGSHQRGDAAGVRGKACNGESPLASFMMMVS